MNAGHDLPTDRDLSLIFGTIITSGSAIIFPLVGLALDGREHSPYWRTVGITFLASEAVLLIGVNTLEDFTTRTAIFPVLTGLLATTLSYKYLPRRTAKSSTALWQYVPQVSVSPLDRGGSIKLNWSF